MPRVIRTPKAEEDLEEIWAYIDQRDPAAANGVLHAIDKTCQNLAHFPQMGRIREEIAHDFLFFPVENYSILY